MQGVLPAAISCSKNGSALFVARENAAEAAISERGEIFAATLSPSESSEHCSLKLSAQELLESAMERLALSARGAHRVIRVARTLTDLEGVGNIQEKHLSEALAYRTLDRPVLTC